MLNVKQFKKKNINHFIVYDFGSKILEGESSSLDY